MTDVVDAKTRSRMMSGIRGKNTKPELIVRKYLHAAGFRFRLHAKDLPGRPDIVLPRHRTVVFVHGCFWHQHKGCSLAATPKSNNAYWKTKLDGNVGRDELIMLRLKEMGWNVLTVWECQIRKHDFTETLSDLIHLRELKG
jgi:DNA mismatch endonuclease (patch repair protein)